MNPAKVREEEQYLLSGLKRIPGGNTISGRIKQVLDRPDWRIKVAWNLNS